MATCLESIGQGGTGALVEILPNTLTPFSATSTTNNLFRLSCPSVQTIKFNFTITSPGPGLVMSIFRVGPVLIGSVTITNPNEITYVDFQVGEYIICIRPTTARPQVGTLLAEFTGYQQFARFVMDVGDGQYCSTAISSPVPPAKPCDEALYFDIIDGELPPGLQMDDLGTITGVLPNLDCLKDRWSPAVNWYYTENDNTAWPWGREWRFQVKVWVDNLELTSYDEEWFCIRIHNNWSYDQERFIEQLPFENVTEVRVVEAPEILMPIQCAPCKQLEDPMFVPKPVESSCAACDDAADEPTKIELIPIPIELASINPDDMLVWFILNDDKVDECCAIEKFKDDLRASPAFWHLRALAGVTDPSPMTEAMKHREFVILQNYQNFLQLATVRLTNRDPNSYETLVKTWQDLENQVLPTSAFAHEGESCEIVFDGN